VFWLAPRLAARLGSNVAPRVSVSAAVVTAATSLAVSYRFFQKSLYEMLRDLAFRLSPPDADSVTGGAVDSLRSAQTMASLFALAASEVLNGRPMLEDLAWLRLILPNLIGMMLVIGTIGFVRALSNFARSRLRNIADYLSDG
jgi:hypothetical protein